MRKMILGASAALMVAGSSVAQAAPVADARAGAPVAQAEDFVLGAHLWLGLLAAGLLIFVLFQINDEGDAQLPTSP